MSITQIFLTLLGVEQAERFFKQFGGAEHYIPKKIENCEQARKLRTVLGDESAEILMQHFGGDKLYIPKGSEWHREQRNQQIKDAFHQASQKYGSHRKAIQQVAIQFNMSERWVYTLTHHQPEAKDERQLVLNWN